MLKIVPVGGGASVLKVEGSTCGRAGRRLRRMIFFTRFPSALVVMMTWSVVGWSVVGAAGTRDVEADASSVVSDGSSALGTTAGGGDCTSAMLILGGVVWEAAVRLSRAGEGQVNFLCSGALAAEPWRRTKARPLIGSATFTHLTEC